MSAVFLYLCISFILSYFLVLHKLRINVFVSCATAIVNSKYCDIESNFVLFCIAKKCLNKLRTFSLSLTNTFNSQFYVFTCITCISLMVKNKRKNKVFHFIVRSTVDDSGDIINKISREVDILLPLSLTMKVSNNNTQEINNLIPILLLLLRLCLIVLMVVVGSDMAWVVGVWLTRFRYWCSCVADARWLIRLDSSSTGWHGGRLRCSAHIDADCLCRRCFVVALWWSFSCSTCDGSTLFASSRLVVVVLVAVELVSSSCPSTTPADSIHLPTPHLQRPISKKVRSKGCQNTTNSRNQT